jgi:hypothetical protein
VEIPSDTPDDKVTAEFDLKQELIDKTFAPEDFTAGLENFIAIPDLPVEIGCNNCSTFGKLTISQGAINIDMSQVDLIPDVLEGGDDGKDLLNVITGGFFELTATNVGAHVDLFARPKVSGSFEIELPGLPIVGFTIPGVGRAGVTFEPSLKADYEVSGGLEIGYGFDVVVSALLTVILCVFYLCSTSSQANPKSKSNSPTLLTAKLLASPMPHLILSLSPPM